MFKENLSKALSIPTEADRALFDIIKEVVNFEPRPGSKNGYEPKLDFVTWLSRTSERVEQKSRSKQE